MSNTVQGFVAKTFEKKFPRKDGSEATAYSCKLESAETGLELEKFYQYGFKPLPFKEGDYVELTVQPKTASADEITGGKIVKNAPARKQKQAAPAQSEGGFGGANDPAPGAAKKQWQGGKSGGGGGFNAAKRDAQWDEKEKYNREVTQPRIQYQAARNAAIEAIAVLLANDGLPTSKAANKAGAATRYEDIVEYINKLTVQFYFDTESLRLLNTVVDSGKVEGLTGVNAQKPEAAPTGTASAAQVALSEDDDVIEDDTGDTSFGN